MVVLLLLLCQLACFQQAKSGQPPKPLLSWRTAASQDDPKIPFWSLNKVAREACGKHGIIRALSAAPGAAGRPCNNLNSPTSQLEAAQHELNSHGSRASSGGTMEEGSHAETADTTASEFEVRENIPRAHHLFTASMNCLPFATSKMTTWLLNQAALAVTLLALRH